MQTQLKEKGSAPPPGRRGVSLTARVGLIVLASVVLAAVFLTLVLNLLARRENAAAVMNVAGRQRMLTQRMVKEALLIASSGDAQARYNLSRWRQEFSANLEALRQGDPAHEIPAPPREVRDHLALIAQEWETFATALDTMAGSPTGSSAQQEALSLVVAGETHLLERVDAVVSLYEEVSVGQERTFGLYLILYALGGGLIALLGLLFASLGVARPLVRLAPTVEAVGLGRPLQLRQQDLRRRDEIGVLNREFESTTTAIMEREKELLESNRRLWEALAELRRAQQQRLQALGRWPAALPTTSTTS